MVPWISLPLADGTFDLGNMHTSKVNTCIYQRRCQICGDLIHGRIVFFVPKSKLDEMWAGEPPLHPECAAYSARACPMLHGGMRTYRKSPSRSEGDAGKRCNEPGCDCAGWRVSQDSRDRERGRPAEAWHAVWCADYTITCPDEETRRLVASGKVPTGVSLGARIDNPLKVRPVRTDTTEECPA